MIVMIIILIMIVTVIVIVIVISVVNIVIVMVITKQIPCSKSAAPEPSGERRARPPASRLFTEYMLLYARICIIHMCIYIYIYI